MKWRTPLKIGFNHTCENALKGFLFELRPNVIRTCFNPEDVQKAIETEVVLVSSESEETRINIRNRMVTFL